MGLRGHIITFCTIHIYISYVHGASENNGFSERKDRHLSTWLRYFQEFNNGQSYAQQIKPYYIWPSVLVLPSINQHQSVTIQENSGQESYQEINKRGKMKRNAKFISESDSIDLNETFNLNKSVITKNSSETNNGLEHSDTFHAQINNMTFITEGNGSYPRTKTEDKNISPLSMAHNQPEEDSTTLQSNEWTENKWNNFVYTRFRPVTLQNYPKPDKMFTAISKNTIPQSYNIFTSYHDFNANHKEWHQTSTMKYELLTINGFKPLAGLYYDGFLQSPLIKEVGFKPSQG